MKSIFCCCFFLSSIFFFREAAVSAQEATGQAEKAALAARAVANAAKDQELVKRRADDGMDMDMEDDK